jgi:DNA-binding CsgD family transcriptional regulator
VSLATIRCHIQSAKRKTSARTLPELVAIATRREVMG